MSTATVDYDALAQQHGGTAQIDYDALAAQHGGSAPSLDLSNKQGQGTYQMKDSSGQSVPVPYGQVQQAARLGYGFADDANRFRYAKDNAADPNRTTTFAPAAGDPRGSVAYQQQLEANAPAAMQVIGGIAKGAGTIASPLLDAANYAANGRTDTASQMLQPNSNLQRAGKWGTLAAAAVPAAVAAPVATAGGAAAGTLGAGAGQLIGNAAGMSPGATQVLSDTLGLAGGAAGAEGAGAFGPKIAPAAAKYFPSFFDNSPEGLLTRAAKPGKNNFNWAKDAPQAISLMKSAEPQLGRPIESIDDAMQAANLAKQNIWGQIKARLNAAGQIGATIDGNQIADAMMDTIGARTRQNNPALVERVTQMANQYRRPLSVDEAEDFLSGKQGVNNELNSYYAKNKVDRRAAEADPEMAATVAEGDALRTALYSKLDQINGPGAAQLKQAYGALSNVNQELAGRKLVWERQNPVSLAEQVSTARGAAKIAKGLIPVIGDAGDIVEGAQNIAVARMGKKLNDPNYMIARAFQNAQPATPFPQPSQFRPAGLLPRGPIQMGGPAEAGGTPSGYTPPPFYDSTRAERLGLLLPEKSGAPPIIPYTPEMSGGERIAALMQMLRNRPQAALPSKASAIPLPPQF